MTPDEGDPVIGEGEWRGRILQERRGDGGFGYDPLFLVMDLGVSSAELGAEEKNNRSHRGQALRALSRKLHETEWQQS